MKRSTVLFTMLVSSAVLGCVPTTGPPTTTTTTTTTVPAEIGITSSDPASPGSSTEPRLRGFAPSGTTVVRIFAGDDCTGDVFAGTPADFTGAGIGVLVGTGTTTTFTAVASGGSGVSACSAPFVYVHTAAIE